MKRLSYNPLDLSGVSGTMKLKKILLFSLGVAAVVALVLGLKKKRI